MIWTIFSNKATSDVYVAQRQAGAAQKISLHQSGKWSYKWNDNKIGARFASKNGRKLDRWDRPAETVPGWTRCLMINVPAEDLVEHPYEETESKPVLLVPPPVPEMGVTFQIALVKPYQGPVNLEGLEPVSGYYLKNGELCVLLAGPLPTPHVPSDALARQRQRVLEATRATGVNVDSSFRLALSATSSNGTRIFWDIAMLPKAKPESRQEVDGKSSA